MASLLQYTSAPLDDSTFTCIKAVAFQFFKTCTWDDITSYYVIRKRRRPLLIPRCTNCSNRIITRRTLHDAVDKSKPKKKKKIILEINSIWHIILVSLHPTILTLNLLFQMLLSHPLFARDPQLQQQIREQIPGFLQQVGWLTISIKDIFLWWRRHSVMWIID